MTFGERLPRKPAHEVLASSEYWQGDINELPVIPKNAAKGDSKDGFFEAFYRHKLASKGEVVVLPIAAGEELPTLTPPNKLIRVVLDTRIEPYKKPFIRNMHTSPRPNSLEEFDERAEHIIADKLYKGQSAQTELHINDGLIRLNRKVGYFFGAKSQLQLAGTYSENIFQAENLRSEFYSDYLLPPLLVGELYQAAPNTLVKAVEASIITFGLPERSKSLRERFRAPIGRLAINSFR